MIELAARRIPLETKPHLGPGLGVYIALGVIISVAVGPSPTASGNVKGTALAATASWKLVPSMPTSRMGHLAAIGANGDIIIVGGIDPQEVDPYRKWKSTFEVFDRNDRHWNPSKELPPPRSGLIPRGPQAIAASILGAPFFATHWVNPFMPTEVVDPAARLYRISTDEAIEIAVTEPARGVFGPVGSLPLLLSPSSDQLLTFGGGIITPERNIHSTSSMYAHNTQRSEWAERKAMMDRRSVATGAVLPDGRILIACGVAADIIDGFPSPIYQSVDLTSAELYDPIEDAWSILPAVPHAHQYGETIVLADGRLAIVGGGESSDIDIYDPSKGIWSTISGLTRTGLHLSIAQTISGEIIVAGGTERTPWLDIIDLSENSVSAIGLPDGMDYAGTISALSPNEFLVTGAGRVNAAILSIGQQEPNNIYLPFAYNGLH